MISAEYPYIAGSLQGHMKALAYDRKFLSLNTDDERIVYIENVIKTARAFAKKLLEEDAIAESNKLVAS